MMSIAENALDRQCGPPIQANLAVEDITEDHGRQLNVDSVTDLGLEMAFPAQPVCCRLVALGVHSLSFFHRVERKA